VLLHCGIGGQALGNRVLIETVGVDEGYRVIVLEKLGCDFKGLFAELKKQGFNASQIAIHCSSKSGATDETLINFQAGVRELIISFSQELYHDERIGLHLVSCLDSQGDLSNASLSDLDIDEKEREILKTVFMRLVFTTTLGEKRSRLYKLARSKLASELLGQVFLGGPGIFVMGIPDNIGGRFSERSQSGEVTSCFAGRRRIFN